LQQVLMANAGHEGCHPFDLLKHILCPSFTRKKKTSFVLDWQCLKEVCDAESDINFARVLVQFQ